MQQRDEPTPDVVELDRLAWNLPPAVKRPSPSHAPSTAKYEREDKHEAGAKTA